MKKSELRQIIKEEITSTLNETPPVLDMMGTMETELSKAIDEVEKVYNIIVAGYDLDPKNQASLRWEIGNIIQNQLK
mgnify:CR=1 FL=1